MKFLEKLDVAILDGLFQKVSDLTNERLGWSCFFLAQISAWFAATAFALGAFAWFDLLGLIAGGFIGFRISRSITKIGSLDDKVRESMEASRVMNPLRISYASYRIRALVMAMLILWNTLAGIWYFWQELSSADTWGGVILALSVWFLLASLYFICCTPKPRSPLKAGNELAAATLPAQ